MRLLTKLFGGTASREPSGSFRLRGAAWSVSPTSDLPPFLRALPRLLPPGSTIYLEDGTPPSEVKAFLDAHCVPEGLIVAAGTIWPRPAVYHLPATAENLAQLAGLAEHCLAVHVAVHFHAYVRDKVVLEWYDAFWKDPLYLSESIAEERVKDFCSLLSLTYKNLKETSSS
jgi:hypothetical protein